MAQTILEALGYDNERLAQEAKAGNVAALDFLIEKYKPLVRGVVWQNYPALQANRENPDPYMVIDVLAEFVLPQIVEKWEPARGSFGHYAKNWGTRRIRDVLYARLEKADGTFHFDRKTKRLYYPRRKALWSIPEERTDWKGNVPATAAEVAGGPIKFRRGYFDRVALASCSEFATDELTAKEIEGLVGGRNLQILQRSAEGETDQEIGDELAVNRTTVGHSKVSSMIVLFKAANRARDLRVAEVIARNLTKEEDEDEDRNAQAEENDPLTTLFLMKYLREN